MAERGRFKLKVGSFGTDEFSIGANMVRENSPVRLWRRVVRGCMMNFIKDPRRLDQFMYHLACTILHELEGYTGKSLMADIKKAPEMDESWG
jgi:hypothetical protein